MPRLTKKSHNNNKCLNFSDNLVRAKIINRPNRFILICSLNSTNETLRVYLPNPGRMTELVFPGIEVLIRPNKDTGPDQKTSHTAIFLIKDDILYLIHSAMANDLAEKLIQKGLIDSLKNYSVKKREFSLSFKSSKTRSRIDFLLEPMNHSDTAMNPSLNKNALCEVKNCNFIINETALFPDAPSIRASRHLNDLQTSSDDYKIFSLVLVTGKKARFFSPNFNTDPDFTQAWFNTSDHDEKPRGSIHHICVYLDIRIISEDKNNNFEFTATPEPIRPDYDLVESRLDDRGAYVILMEIPDKAKIKIGALGYLQFKPGWYLYTGSAMKNLDKRVKRHLRKMKKFHWHIDYLMAHTSSAKALLFRDSEKRECHLAQFLSQIAESQVANFGCSDCSCSSHLFYFKNNPMKDVNFVDRTLEFGFRVK